MSLIEDFFCLELNVLVLSRTISEWGSKCRYKRPAQRRGKALSRVVIQYDQGSYGMDFLHFGENDG